MTHPKELDPKELKPIAELIDLVYSGNPHDMKDDLHQIIYLLHYVDQTYINREELERAVFTLNELGERLQKIQDQLEH